MFFCFLGHGSTALWLVTMVCYDVTVVKICNWECARRVGRVGAPPEIFNPPFPILKVERLATPGCYSNVFNSNYCSKVFSYNTNISSQH